MRRLLASLLLVSGLACSGSTGGGGKGGNGNGGNNGIAGRGGTGTTTGGAGGGAGSGAGGTAVGSGGSGGNSAGTGGGAGSAGTGGVAGSAGTGGTTGTAGRGGGGGTGGGTGGGAGRGGASGGGMGGGVGGRGGTGGTAGTAGTTGGAGAGGGATCGAMLFDHPHPWTTDVSAYPVASVSGTIINGLIAAGGWGQGNVFLTDDSIVILDDDGSAPLRTFTPTSDFYTPDCDNVPFPVPAGGAIEGETGYACTGDGDCHLLVVERTQKKLYEMYRANITGSSVAQFLGGCVALWDLSKQYGSTLRGKGCSSADAGGFPMTAMLPTADEVASGCVGHALRFILPNDRIRDGIYVPPSTHSTGPTNGGPNTPPYGVRFRLKASVDTSGFSAGGKVLAQALKTYGMFLSDGGNIAVTIASDRFTTAKWSALGVTNNRSLASLTVGDFEVVDYGTEVDWNANTDCIRNP